MLLSTLFGTSFLYILGNYRFCAAPLPQTKAPTRALATSLCPPFLIFD